MPQKDIINKINRYIELLKDEGFYFKKVILYGSHARDEAGQDSDIDVLLVSDIFDTDDDYIKSKPWLLAAQIDYHIEPYIVSYKKYQIDDVSPLFDIIREEGIEIVS